MERRLRTSFVVRERLWRIARTASIIGPVVVAIAVIVSAGRQGFESALDSRGFMIGSMLLLAAGFFVPRWVARLRWRQLKRRHYEEWQ